MFRGAIDLPPLPPLRLSGGCGKCGRRTSLSKHPITITLNGDARRVQSQSTLLQLLQRLQLDPQRVVVELNRRIVRRPELEETRLAEGDRVELVHFVGGG